MGPKIPKFDLPETMLKRLSQGLVYCLGRAGMDLYPEPPGTRTEDATHFISDLGGSSANIAVALARRGRQAALLSVFSDDSVGRFAMEKCKAYGVDVSYCRVQPGHWRNNLAIAETRPEDAQVVIYRHHAADLQLSTRDVDRVDFSGAGALIITGTALSGEPSSAAVRAGISRAHDAGCPVIIDIDYRANAWRSPSEAALHIYPELEKAQIIIGNDDEFGVMAGGDHHAGLACAIEFSRQGRLVLYKKGAKGCNIFHQDTSYEMGVYPVVLAKPFGAGDAFLGNLLATLGDNFDIIEAVRAGSAAAALVVSKTGCASAMPDTKELAQFMRQNQQRTG